MSLRRIDNITDQALADYRSLYDDDVSKDAIFSFIYGLLHSPDYHERYAVDLSKLLPRIPDLASADDFWAFSKAGARLMFLHLNYEQVEPWPLVEHWKTRYMPPGDERWRVEKMRWAGKRDRPYKAAIRVNDWLTLRGIPQLAHSYIIGPRSALEWLIYNYRVRRHKESGIVNDVNDWGLEHGKPDYIPDLIKRVTRVSVETMQIVSTLPPLVEAEQQRGGVVRSPQPPAPPVERPRPVHHCRFCGSTDVTWWRPDRCYAHDGNNWRHT